MDRRDFLKNSMIAGTLLPLQFNPELKNKLKPIMLATNWGFKGSTTDFCKAVREEGYDGVELWWNSDLAYQKVLYQALEKYDLKIGFLMSGNAPDFETHFTEFKKNLSEASEQTTVKPLYINCHSGKDFFEFELNAKIIEYVIEKADKTGIEIIHETHRSRMCYSAPLTAKYLKKYPEMRLTLDISHWTNVHESLLQDQVENVKLALARTQHVHLRVGHQEGPQVNDPRAPEWKNTMNAHLQWWDEVVENRIKDGATQMTFLSEFGPPNYLPIVPYTNQPLANQWEINVYMMNLIRKRYL